MRPHTTESFVALCVQFCAWSPFRGESLGALGELIDSRDREILRCALVELIAPAGVERSR